MAQGARIVIDQIMRAVVWRNRKLFIRREGQNNVAVGLEPLLGIFKLYHAPYGAERRLVRSWPTAVVGRKHDAMQQGLLFAERSSSTTQFFFSVHTAVREDIARSDLVA